MGEEFSDPYGRARFGPRPRTPGHPVPVGPFIFYCHSYPVGRRRTRLTFLWSTHTHARGRIYTHVWTRTHTHTHTRAFSHSRPLSSVHVSQYHLHDSCSNFPPGPTETLTPPHPYFPPTREGTKDGGREEAVPSLHITFVDVRVSPRKKGSFRGLSFVNIPREGYPSVGVGGLVSEGSHPP